MSLHDTAVRRFFATGVAGLSCAADSLSAIKYANVYPEKGFAVENVYVQMVPAVRHVAVEKPD